MSCSYLAWSVALIAEPPHRHPVLQSSPSVTLTQSESVAHEVSNIAGDRSMHASATAASTDASTSLVVPQSFEPTSHNVHAPSTHSTLPPSAQGQSPAGIDPTSDWYCESADALMGVSPQRHEFGQIVPVVTRVQSDAEAQLRLKLDAWTVTHDPLSSPSVDPPPPPVPPTFPPHAAKSPRRESVETTR